MDLPRTARLAGICLALTLAGNPALAHVPFLETTDYTAEKPFVVEDVAQSKALYGWLESPGDVDFYSMKLTGPTRIYMRTLVPDCAEYQQFGVTYALVGPGLPGPTSSLPFDLPTGYGAIVVRDGQADASARPTLYEQFSGRYYFEGPEFEFAATAPGEYRMVVWSETHTVGDYVAVIGRAEKFSAADMWRAAQHTMTLRRAGELHGSCTAPPARPSATTVKG